ncbi:MAG: hypothetical protein KC469_11305 [Flavobacteriaceae bacterium]|nr:hypothetical protein [Flavobacteriaceae bacterium]
MKNRLRIIAIVLILLCLPFAIKTLDINLEVFPSVILPSYSQPIKIDKDVNLTKYELYAIDKTGKQKKVDHHKFFNKPLFPYSNWIIRNNFGLNNPEVKTHRTVRLGFSYTTRSKTTEAEVLKTKKWLSKRLLNQGFVDSFLIVKKNKLILSKETRKQKMKVFINDTIFQLYK